jgi:hypothetical protein
MLFYAKVKFCCCTPKPSARRWRTEGFVSGEEGAERKVLAEHLRPEKSRKKKSRYDRQHQSRR